MNNSKIEKFFERYPTLASCRDDVLASCRSLEAGIRNGGTIFTCGNGGSASDADHIVGELVKSFQFKRALSDSFVKALKDTLNPKEAQDITMNLEGSIPAIPLGHSQAFNSAFGNDVEHKYMFAQHLSALGKPNDILIAISTSGNSENIVLAAKVAKSMGIQIIALSGETGGKLSEWSDICIKAPSTLVHEIQEYHLPIYHLICAYLEDTFFQKTSVPTKKSIPTQTQDTRRTKQKNIHMVAFDFDGVFTDNSVLTLSNGEEAVRCSKSDSLGLKMLKKANIPVVVISTEENISVKMRCDKLGIPCYLGIEDKLPVLKKIAREKGLNLENIAYMGNDFNDLDCIQEVGLSFAPCDAVSAVRAKTDIVTTYKGGSGAVRQAVEHILATQI